MPDCKECRFLSYEGKPHCCAYEKTVEELKRPMADPPLGACTWPIVHSYLEHIKPGFSVLEIGCGSWAKIRDACRALGAAYEAIDTEPSYFGVPTIATRYENLASLSFENETFDLVIGNQTMEHWAEHGCSIEWGLWQCFRVLKPGARVLLNVPIHFHGTRPFLLGSLDVLKKAFEPFSSQVVFESWGKNAAPLAPQYMHPKYKKLANQCAYILDIQAVKDRPLPLRARKKKVTGRLGRIIEYPLSYNLYRWRDRLAQRIIAG